MNIENRIKRLEKLFKTPEGTQIVRILDEKKGTNWSIGFGQLMTPKDFFIGKTITKALTLAEKHLL